MKAKIPGIERPSGETQALFEAVNDERDLPCVLVSTSFLDQSLASLLSSFMIKSSVPKALLSHKGAVGAFFPRTQLSYSLGLISKEMFQNLKVVGDIRNMFAHSHLSLSFAEPDIVKLCEQLQLPSIFGKQYDGQTGEEVDFEGWPDVFAQARPRFTVTVVLMANELLSIGKQTLHRERKQDVWSSRA